MSTIQKALTPEEIKEFREIFSLVDSDGSGEIDEFELKELMETLGLVPTKEEIQQMLLEVDTDGNKLIDFDEFCTVMSSKVETSYSQKELTEAFKLFEDENDETGCVNELIYALCTYGNEKITQEEAIDLVSTLQKDGSEKINYMEHISMLSN